MRKIKRISPVRPRRVVRELTPEEKAQDEALIAEALASWETPEGQARWRFFEEEGCAPEVKDFRDNLIAQGYPKQVANTVAGTEWLRMNGYKPTRQKDPYTEK